MFSVNAHSATDCRPKKIPTQIIIYVKMQSMCFKAEFHRYKEI